MSFPSQLLHSNLWCNKLVEKRQAPSRRARKAPGAGLEASPNSHMLDPDAFHPGRFAIHMHLHVRHS